MDIAGICQNRSESAMFVAGIGQNSSVMSEYTSIWPDYARYDRISSELYRFSEC
jgi:hypothetical protein